MLDVSNLLELLHTNNDYNVQIKLFSTLSACIMSNVDSVDAIITHNSIYDKICYILLNCPLNKATVMFNFLSALIYTVDEDTSRRKFLSAYAKNMIRSSGCLASMCDLFSNCMMHQDAWRSLCQCLAETCRGIEANQSYCTHLIPMCIQRCSQRNIEAFLVLQSLLQNHTKNIKLFTECNGISVFQRAFLQHEICLQLLSTLTQSSTQFVQLITDTEICQNLRDFSRSYGPQSQLGQWATVILYHITGPEGFRKHETGLVNKPNKKTINNSISVKTDLQCTTDTTKFLQNVMQEIMQCVPPSDLKYLQEETNYRKPHELHLNHSIRNKMQMSQRNVASQCNFLCPENYIASNGSMRNTKYSNLAAANETIKYVPSVNIISKTSHANDLKSTENSFDIFESFLNENFSRHYSPELRSFKPKFASTPIKCNSSRLDRSKSIEKVKMRCRMKRKQIFANSMRKPSRIEQNTIDKEIKHRSISGWFFESINQSCTAFVKTVKSIFKPKIAAQDLEVCSNPATNESSYSYSFTNYMKKRDAILNNEFTKKCGEDFTMDMYNVCKTCNDTLELKNKLANDEYLKQTVRKLKLGINLYGCDFKKISKHLWPQQTYMTPTVLYNLYRKLIIK